MVAVGPFELGGGEGRGGAWRPDWFLELPQREIKVAARGDAWVERQRPAALRARALICFFGHETRLIVGPGLVGSSSLVMWLNVVSLHSALD